MPCPHHSSHTHLSSSVAQACQLAGCVFPSIICSSSVAGVIFSLASIRVFPQSPTIQHT